MQRHESIIVVLMLTTLIACSNDKASDSASNASGDSWSGQYSDEGMILEDSYGGRTALVAGDWDPPAERQKPMSGTARTRQLKWSAMINAESKRAGIDPRFIHAVISQESRYSTNAISPVGAQGLMQLMPNTSREMGLDPSLRRSHPRKNVIAGIGYLQKMRWANGNLQAMAAGYNSGPARAKALFRGNTGSKYWAAAQKSTRNGVPGPNYERGETYNYARKVAGYYELYVANPHLIGLGVEDEQPSKCHERDLC